MAEQLPIVGWRYDVWEDFHLTKQQLDHTFSIDKGETFVKGTALTPHAPAQSALDELRAENAALKEKLQDQALQELSDDGQWMERTDELRRQIADRDEVTALIQIERDEARQARDELRREVEALRADRDRLDWLDIHGDAVRMEVWEGMRSWFARGAPGDRKTVRAAIDTARASTDEGVGK